MKMVIAITYVVLFHLSAKVVFAILGGFEMGKGLLGIDWVGVVYMGLISLLAAMATVVSMLLVGEKQNTKQLISIAVISIFTANIYQFLQSPRWFLNTLTSNTAHIVTTNLVFGIVLVVVYLGISKANQALLRTRSARAQS